MLFQKAMARNEHLEAGYLNDPNDAGGETIDGIARNYNPNLGLWDVVDAAKSKPNFPHCLEDDVFLQRLIYEFYFVEHWQKPRIKDIAERNETIGIKLFTLGVHFGTRRPCKWLQRAINVLNRNATRYPDITADGIIGPTSIKTFEQCLDNNPEQRILNVMTAVQGAQYLNKMENDPTQEKWVGWFDRLSFG